MYHAQSFTELTSGGRLKSKPQKRWLNVIAVLHTLSLNIHDYWAKLFDELIQKPALRRRSTVNLLRLNLTQTGIDYLKFTNPHVIRNFELFFNGMNLYSFKTSRRSNKYKQVTQVLFLWDFCFIIITFFLNMVFKNFSLRKTTYIHLKIKM